MTAQGTLRRVLEVTREELGMDVAWISRFESGQQVLTLVDGATEQFGIEDGTATSLAGSYCTRVVGGELPNVIPDAAADPRTANLAVTDQLGIGSYAGVPINGPDGEVFGMLCCIGRGPNNTIRQRELRLLQILAEAAAVEVAATVAERASVEERRARVEQVLREEALEIVLQPIVNLSSMAPMGAEGLARFPSGGGPDIWFAEAAAVGLGADLELVAVRRALRRLSELDAHLYVGVNVSPAVAIDPRFAEMVRGSEPSRIVIEVTEHAAVPDYDTLHAALQPLRRAGARLAVDDAGAGYASFRHILALRPDIIKLDIGITAGLDHDPVRQALARALVDFAQHVSASIVAEGVETQDELDTLLRLGVTCAQGYFLAKPGPLPLPAIAARPAPRLLRTSMPAEPLAVLAERAVTARTFDEFIEPVLETVEKITGLEVSYFSVLQDGQLTQCNVHTSAGLKASSGRTYPWDDSLCDQCRRAGILWTADVAADLEPTVEDAHISTFMSVPVTTPDGELLGTLCAVGLEARYLSDHVIAEVQQLAHLVAGRLMQEHATSGSRA